MSAVGNVIGCPCVSCRNARINALDKLVDKLYNKKEQNAIARQKHLDDIAFVNQNRKEPASEKRR